MMRLLTLPLLASLQLAAQIAPPHYLWDTDQVHTVKLAFSQPDWYQQLRVNFEGKADPDYMPVDVEIGDRSLPKSGIRFKGNSSYNSYPGQKKSFKIKFDKYDKKQHLEGVTTINLNNAFKDPSFVREKMYYELAAGLGLAASRVSYAAVYINDRYWGLYFLTEQVDKILITGRFGSEEDGNLFKGDPRGTLEYRGDDPAPYKQMYELETNEKADDWSDLIALSRALNLGPMTDLPTLLDIEGALSLVALDNYTVNLDSYIGSGHNYYIYHRMSDGLFTPIPWDPNEAWGVFTLNMPLQQLTMLPILYPMNSNPVRPLAARLLAVPEYRQRYIEKMQSLAVGIGHPDVLVPRMNALRDMIRPFVQDDNQKMFTDRQFEDAMQADVGGGAPAPPGSGPGLQPPPPGGVVPGLEKFLRARHEFVQRQ